MALLVKCMKKGEDNLGHITLKSRAHQRFQVVPQKDGTLTTTRQTDVGRIFYANIKILPEIILPDPIISINSSNNLLKFTNNKSQKNKTMQLMTCNGVWPKFVYQQYEISSVLKKVEAFLDILKIDISTVPKEMIGLSFWLARNLPLSSKERERVFVTNCVNKRMLTIGKFINLISTFVCKRCNNKIAPYAEIFAMSKNGVQSNYCNPAGYIHETVTVYKIIDNSLDMVQRPSTEFSWFPGTYNFINTFLSKFYLWSIQSFCNNNRFTFVQKHVSW